MWPCSVMVTVLELGDSSYCYIIEVFFFSPPYFRSWYHLSCFSCIADSGLEVSSGLASQGEPVTLSVKGDLDPTLPACLPGQLDDQERGVTGWVSVSGAVHRSLVVNLVLQAE